MRFAVLSFLTACLMLPVSGVRPNSTLAQPANSKAENGMSGMAKEMRAMNKMMVHHLGKKDAEYEKRFIDMMIPHHEGASLVAKHALEHANQPELKEMAKKMIEDQQKEIEHLKKWREKWYSDNK
ncbi:MAG: DUF305 domain-containing protein [Gemmataceae bacterium]|nr:DUF305 domain-containing protein [Gemmataceae bacterium]